MKNLLQRFGRACVTQLGRPVVVRPLGILWMRLHGRWRTSETSSDLRSARNVVVVRYDGLGDLVVTTGFLRDLRAALPQARITVIVRHDWVDLLAACPHVDRVLAFDLEFYPRYTPIRTALDMAAFCRRQLWPERPDAVFFAQTHITQCEARYLALFSGAPLRLARVASSARGEVSPENDPGWKIFSEVSRDASTGHEVNQLCAWLGKLGLPPGSPKLELFWDAAATEKAARLLGKRSASGFRAIVGIGASHEFKTWPLDRFIELSRRLKHAGARLVVVGSAELSDVANAFVSALDGDVVNLVGQLRLQETAAVFSQCDLYVGNDTGPMHIAAAVGLPVVEIVGWPDDVPPEVPGSPLRMGPVCAHRRIVQPRGNGQDWSVRVGEVSIESAWTAVESLLKEVGLPRSFSADE